MRRGPLAATARELLTAVGPGWPRRERHRLEPEVVERVRERLADRPGELSPHRVAEALRATG